MKITEKAAYLKGLATGLGLGEDTKEAKVIHALIDLVDDMALTISDLEEGFNSISDQLDAVDEDLCSLEEDFYEDEDEDEDDDDVYYEVTCPACNQTVCMSEDLLLRGEITCPNCGENLEFDLEDIECDDDCCCHDEDCSCSDDE